MPAFYVYCIYSSVLKTRYFHGSKQHEPWGEEQTTKVVTDRLRMQLSSAERGLVRAFIDFVCVSTEGSGKTATICDLMS